MSKRRSSIGKVVHINLSDIKFDRTYRNMVPGGLHLSVACDICKPRLDIHTKISSKPFKKETKACIELMETILGF